MSTTSYSEKMTDLKEVASIDQHEYAQESVGPTIQDARTSGIVVTAEDDARIRRKIDKNLLPVLVWVYFLQIFDKSLLGYASTYGLQKDAHLVGTQYSFVGSIAAIAQICWLPFSSWLIVKVPPRPLMMTLVFGWGAAEVGMAFSTNYAALVATRFLLGLFEAACLPLFAVITAQWYRRSEQPLRVAIWYGTNGIATILAAFISYGLGKINHTALYSWQYIFLLGGLLTVLTPAFIWWKLDNDVGSARFLTEQERAIALERLKSNQTGVGTTTFRWKQAFEALIEPKTWLWIGMSLTLNVGAAVTNVFGPLILQGLPIPKGSTTLMNSVFGFFQLVAIIISSYAAAKWKLKSVVLLSLIIPVIVGLALLYTLKHTQKNLGPLLLGYYLLAFLFGGNPLICSWIIGNTAGQTKKSITMVAYNIGSSAGNIIGPLLFNAKDKPQYLPGIRGCLGCFIALAAMIGLQVGMLMFLNKSKEKERVKNGKPAKIVDRSMDNQFHAHDAESQSDEIVAGEKIQDLEITDKQNDMFVYVY